MTGPTESDRRRADQQEAPVQGSLSEGETTSRGGDGESRDDGAVDPRKALLDRARRYARTVDVDVDLSRVSWDVSTRAKRRAGVCLYDASTGDVTIRLTLDAYRQYDWEEFAAVIRHELVHAWEFQSFGESGHGDRFARKAADLDVSRYCRSFADGRLRLVCRNEDCSWSVERHRASVSVTAPEDRRCGSCGSRYVVEHVATGERWHTRSGYESARDRIGDEW